MMSAEGMTERAIRTPVDLDTLTFREGDLLPVVTQDADTGRVLMLAFANREALERSLETGEMHYWSRSRRELWHKGATSGNCQALISLHRDCDGDAVLARVKPRGPACHTGDESCFGRLGPGPDAKEMPPTGNPGSPGDAGAERPGAIPGGETILPALWATLTRREQERPHGSYTVRLLEDENLRLKKLGEETAELLLALARGDRKGIADEGADLVYHLFAAMLGAGVGLEDLLSALERRQR
jgi:phosphoribosyl-ATP pyrophosphohydrolase/phosphoribosyl-AMP cyclohydrolase